LPVHKSAHLPVHVYYIFEEREREREKLKNLPHLYALYKTVCTDQTEL